MKYFGTLILVFSFNSILGQIREVDSLKQELANGTMEDSIQNLLYIADAYVYAFPDSSIFYVNQAAAIYNRINPEPNGQLIARLGKAAWVKGQLLIAMSYFRKAQQIALKKNDYNLLGRVLNGMGVIHRVAGEYSIARKYYREGITAYNQVNAVSEIGNLLNNMGKAFIDEGQLDSARHYLSNALTHVNQKNQRSVPIMVFNFGDTYLKENRLDSAAFYFELSKQKANHQKIKRAYLMAQGSLAKIKLLRNAPQMAQLMMDSIIDELHHTKAMEIKYLGFDTYSQILKENNQPEKALEYFQLAILYRDSLQDKTFRSQLNLANYKEQVLENELNQEKENLFKVESDLKTLLIIGLFVFGLLTGVISIILWWNRRKEKAAQTIIAQNEALYRLVAENSSDGVSKLDKDLKPLYISPSVKKVAGLDHLGPNDPIPSLFHFIHPEDQSKITQNLKRAQETGEKFIHHQYRFRTYSGKYIWIEDFVTLEYTPQGEAAVAYVNSRNITDRVMAEEALKNSSALLDATGKLAKVGGWELFPESGELNWTAETYRIHKIEPGSDIALDKAINFYHPEDQPVIAEAVTAAIEKGRHFDLELRIITATKAVIHVRAMGSRNIENDGRVRVFGAFQDITLQKKANLELERSARLLKTTQRLAQLGGWEYKLKDQSLNWTEELYHIFEMAHDLTPTLQSIIDHLDYSSGIQFKKAIEEAIKKQRPFDLELELITPSNKHKWLKILGTPVLEEETVLKIVGIIQDISTKKEIEKIRELAHELSVRNKEMEEFAYAASHDLQEPLRTVISFVQLLKRKLRNNLDEDAQSYMNFISDASGRMSELITSLLNYSRLGKNGTMDVVDFNQLLKLLQDDIQSTILENHAKIIVHPLPKLFANETDMRQLFQNLISNGIKFRKKEVDPVIEISATLEGEYWKFAVKDNGIGIEEKFHSQIFQIFQRLNDRGKYGGTGIGLANCQKIVELNQGKIWVDSELGKGSTFYFTLRQQTNTPSISETTKKVATESNPLPI